MLYNYLWHWLVVLLLSNLYLSGDVAQLCRQTQSLLSPPAALTIRQVYSVLRKIRYGYPS